MSQTTERPASVRVRCNPENGNGWRYDSIQNAADYYGKNKSDAIAHACSDVPALVEAIATVLDRGDLTRDQKREIAETCSTRAVTFDLDEQVEVDHYPNPEDRR